MPPTLAKPVTAAKAQPRASLIHIAGNRSSPKSSNNTSQKPVPVPVCDPKLHAQATSTKQQRRLTPLRLPDSTPKPKPGPSLEEQLTTLRISVTSDFPSSQALTEIQDPCTFRPEWVVSDTEMGYVYEPLLGHSKFNLQSRSLMAGLKLNEASSMAKPCEDPYGSEGMEVDEVDEVKKALQYYDVPWPIESRPWEPEAKGERCVGCEALDEPYCYCARSNAGLRMRD
jgi:hypothetical protein